MGARVLLAAAAAGLLVAPAPASAAGGGGFCAVDPAGPPEYYAFPLVTTKNLPGTAATEGTAVVHFGSTPYGVSLAPDGSFRYQVDLTVRELPARDDGAYVAWVTTPSLDRIERLGTLDADGALRGTVRWNKYLVVVTLEPESAVAATNGGNGNDGGSASSSGRPDAWTGPIVLRGMSKSGMMHTMAGHGPFQQENCAAYGF